MGETTIREERGTGGVGQVLEKEKAVEGE